MKAKVGDLLQLLTNLKNKKIEFYFHKKINYGLPFGIIFIAGNSDNPIDIDNKTKKLASCFRDDKSNCFIDYPITITIEDYLILDNLKSCFVFQNKPNVTLFDNDENDRPFNLIELIGNDSDFREILLEFSENIPKAPNEIPQFLTNFKNSKIPNDRYLWHGYSKIPQEKRIAKIKEQMNEEIKINPSFCSYRVISEQNRKINEIAEGLERR
nr:hypothetical protein [Helicobacter pylori]